jgi:hypothetical protein
LASAALWYGIFRVAGRFVSGRFFRQGRLGRGALVIVAGATTGQKHRHQYHYKKLQKYKLGFAATYHRLNLSVTDS